jgi:opacity protein-like surface antigen
MKKVVIPVLMAAAIMSAINANAQQKKNFISGQIGFNSSKQETSGQADIKRSGFSIGPTYGRYLNEKFSFGIGLGYASSKEDDNPSSSLNKVKSFNVTPFLRFEQPLWNSKISVYNEIGVSAGYGETKSDRNNFTDSKIRNLSLYYTPGLMFNFTPRCAMIASLGSLLGASVTTSERLNGSSKTTESRAGVISGFGINSVQFGFLFRF